MPVSFGRADAAAGTPLRILCYGDSLTAGFAKRGHAFEPYGRTLAEALTGLGTPCEVSVCGGSGKTATEMVGGLDSGLTDIVGNWGKGLRRTLREEGPFDLVLIMAGTNDIGYDHRTDEIVNDVRQLHAACHDLGVQTCLLPPPSAPCGDEPWHAARRQVLHRLEELAESMPGIVGVIDPASIVPASVGPAAAGAGMWDPDQLHFSPAGSRFLGRELAPRVLKLVQMPKRNSPPAPKKLLPVPPRALLGPATAAAADAAAAPLLARARCRTAASPVPTVRRMQASTSAASLAAAPARTVATAAPAVVWVPPARQVASCQAEVASSLAHRECANVILAQ